MCVMQGHQRPLRAGALRGDPIRQILNRVALAAFMVSLYAGQNASRRSRSASGS
jgi:hypothetical protein